MNPMDELKKAQFQSKLNNTPDTPNTAAPTTPATPPESANSAAPSIPTPPVAGTGSASPYGPNGNRSDLINSLMEAKRDAKLEAIENAYIKNKQTQEEAMGKIPGTYQERANDLAIQTERKRHNFNQRAAAYGLNSGTAAQADLAFDNNYSRDFGKIQSAQADAVAAAQRDLNNLGLDRDKAINDALNEFNYDKAAALMDEAKDQYNRDLNKANMMAKYGDFTGIQILFGDEAAKNMEKGWIAENPDMAYNIGKITADEYYHITGTYPKDLAAQGGGGYFGGQNISNQGQSYNGWQPNGGGGRDLLQEEIQQMISSGADVGEVNSMISQKRASGQITPEQYNSHIFYGKHGNYSQGG